MKKILVKAAVFVTIFFVSLLVVGMVMNKDHDNITMEMAEAAFPIIVMEKNNQDYNELHGYSQVMNPAFQRDTITVLGENRETSFTVKTFGTGVNRISMEVRSMDGERLVENTEITDYDSKAGFLSADIALKDLIEKDKEYMLVLILDLESGQKAYYYTRVIWSEGLYADEKLAFVKDFHERLYDKTRAKELTKYLETNSQLQDNRSFHYVNIHSSFKQITWGDLKVSEETLPNYQLKDIAGQTATIVVDFIVSSGNGKEKTYYQVEEYYRVRHTATRMYLLDYERNMTQIPDVDSMYANDKILLGITGTDIQMTESEDGNIVVFEVANRLFSYNVTTNKLAVIFSFYDEENADARTLHDDHSIKILDVDEGGNVQFAVYGYMNRGRHEGEVGIQLYAYNNSLNTLEEMVYIPQNKSYAVLEAELRDLLYLNREQKLYLTLDDKVYCVDLLERSYEEVVTVTQDDVIQVSDNHRILVALMVEEGEDVNRCNRMSIRNLNHKTEQVITVGNDEAIRPLGFMGEDVIYGVAKLEDVVEETTGRVFFPMYKICISNSAGELLKEYEQPGIYVMDCSVEDNQITLERKERLENGEYRDIAQDHIMNNEESDSGKNVIVAANIDIYEQYVQIQTKAMIDGKTIQILTPKEVVFEGGRELQLEAGESGGYYVYGPYGVNGIYHSPATAVSEAYEPSAVVVDESGNYVWIKGNRVNKNQIMAIKEETVTEEKNSLAVCLDTILKFEGIIRNSQELLAQGETVAEILGENLENAQILDLTGCNLDAVLYYVNQDIPVLAMLQDGEAVLITGFNEFNVVIMNPKKGTLAKMGMNDATEWFAENGNSFITYVRGE
ncbi:MAG: hypothetical protein II994_03415 [Lachnospiraceae bacterium]|nr:hypothetical protein [Lachnospiraceae bacterium]